MKLSRFPKTPEVGNTEDRSVRELLDSLPGDFSTQLRAVLNGERNLWQIESPEDLTHFLDAMLKRAGASLENPFVVVKFRDEACPEQHDDPMGWQHDDLNRIVRPLGDFYFDNDGERVGLSDGKPLLKTRSRIQVEDSFVDALRQVLQTDLQRDEGLELHLQVAKFPQCWAIQLCVLNRQ